MGGTTTGRQRMARPTRRQRREQDRRLALIEDMKARLRRSGEGEWSASRRFRLVYVSLVLSGDRWSDL